MGSMCARLAVRKTWRKTKMSGSLVRDKCWFSLRWSWVISVSTVLSVHQYIFSTRIRKDNLRNSVCLSNSVIYIYRVWYLPITDWGRLIDSKEVKISVIGLSVLLWSCSWCSAYALTWLWRNVSDIQDCVVIFFWWIRHALLTVNIDSFPGYGCCNILLISSSVNLTDPVT